MSEIKVDRVAVRPLDTDEFRRYGSVIEPSGVDDPKLNRAPGQMAFMWVHQFLKYPKPPFIATCRYHYRGSRCEYVQQHPESTVVLIPLDGKPSVVMLMPDRDGMPNVDAAEAVLLDGRRGIVVDPGNWLRYAYPILDTASYTYISSRVDPEDDIRRVNLETEMGLVLEWYFGPPDLPGVKLSPSGAVIGLPSPEGRDLELGVGGVVIRPPRS